MEEAVVS